jgi:hypothetical protein
MLAGLISINFSQANSHATVHSGFSGHYRSLPWAMVWVYTSRVKRYPDSVLILLALTTLAMALTSFDAVSQSLREGNISSADDCTQITINYTLDGQLTREEAISRMDEAFYESLNQFDSCQMSRSAASGGASAGSGASGSGDGNSSGSQSASSSAEGSAGSGGSQSSLSSTRSVASPNLSGTDTAVSDSSISAAAKTQASIVSKATDKLHKTGKTGDLPVGSGKIPEDIPPSDNDSILEAQIRQAAMNEADPGTREKLWREYRKYKGLPPPAGQAAMPNEE